MKPLFRIKIKRLREYSPVQWVSIGIVALVALAAIFLLVKLIHPRQILRREWLILTGHLVDAGGYRLRIDCYGEGSPVVVMDSGLTFTRSTWDNVTPEVAKFTRVCVYDRAGLGDSDPGPTPRTSQLAVNDLHVILSNAGIFPPYILVGHSIGGLNVRLYASENPDEVVGMVLVDSSHEDEYADYAALMSPADKKTYLDHEGGENFEKFDLLTSAQQVRSAGPLPDIPLIVLTHGHPDPDTANNVNTPKNEEIWRKLQEDLAHRVPHGVDLIAQKSGHFIQNDRPDLVINSIHEIFNEVH
jgi:pimeloyl-ACP methyl ester carboxylesterase